MIKEENVFPDSEYSICIVVSGIAIFENDCQITIYNDVYKHRDEFIFRALRKVWGFRKRRVFAKSRRNVKTNSMRILLDEQFSVERFLPLLEKHAEVGSLLLSEDCGEFLWELMNHQVLLGLTEYPLRNILETGFPEEISDYEEYIYATSADLETIREMEQDDPGSTDPCWLKQELYEFYESTGAREYFDSQGNRIELEDCDKYEVANKGRMLVRDGTVYENPPDLARFRGDAPLEVVIYCRGIPGAVSDAQLISFIGAQGL